MASPPTSLPLILPVHPPHRSGPGGGFSSFAGSLLPFGNASSTSAPVPQGRRRRANAVSIPRPAFVQVREPSDKKDREEEDEDVAMRWVAEEGVPTSPRVAERKGSTAGMEWEGVVRGMEDVGLNGGQEVLASASTSACTPAPPLSSPPGRTSPVSLLLSLPPVPSVTSAPPPTSCALQLAMAPSSSSWAATSVATSSPPRPLKRNRAAFAGEADDVGAREAKRFAACGYFDLVAAASSATPFGLGPSMELRQRAPRTIAAPRSRRMLMSRTVSVM